MQRWLLAIFLAIIAAPAGAQTPIAPEPPKFAHVSGVVIDEQDGRLLRRAMVCLNRAADNGYSDPSTAHCTETDTQGRFSFDSLPPSRYFCRVEREGYFEAQPIADGLPSLFALNAGDDLSGVKLHMRRLGSLSGRVVFVDGEPFPGADLSLNGKQEKTGDTGEYRIDNVSPGDYQILVNPPAISSCDSGSNRKPRLYAERAAGQEKPPVHVDSGQQANAPDIVMVEVMPHRISGRIVAESYPLPGLWRIMTGHTSIQVRNSDGSFTICGMVAGEYTLRANSRRNDRTVAGELKIRIEDEDLKDLEMVPEDSATIRARIEVEDNTPLDLAHATIFGFPGPFPHESVPQSRREPDGSFLMDEVYTGEYRFEVGPLPPGSYLKSARINGQDVIDTPLLVHGGESLDGLVFTVSPKGARLTGVVQDETGQPVPDAPIIMRADPKHIDVDIHSCIQQTDQNGGFTCDGLAPGKYRIAAWRTFPPDGLQAQNEVELKGTPVELSESDRASITLTVSKR
jgi:Carboxypeptidase regulatory-like domain